MKQRISVFVLVSLVILSLVILYATLNLSSPGAAGPIGVLFVFSLIYVLAFSSLALVARVVEIVYKLALPDKKASEGKSRVLSNLRRKKTNFMLAALSLVPIFIISLNSIGELGFIDVMLIVVIELLLIFYISKKN